MNHPIACCALVFALAIGPAAHARQAPAPPPPATPAPAETPAPPDDDAQVGERIRRFSVERREDAIAAARQATDAMDRQMERMQAQLSAGWSRMNATTRDRSERALADLRKRRNALAEWVGGMQHGSTAAWTEVRNGFARSYDELAAAMRQARADLQQAAPEAKEAKDADADKAAEAPKPSPPVPHPT